MNKYLKFSVIISLALLILSNTVLAHHSRATFLYDRKVNLEGTITEYSYRNPHIYLTIDVENDEGSVEEWILEANALSTLSKFGWERDSFSEGDQVTVQANPNRDSSRRNVLVDTITKADGAVFSSSEYSPGSVPSDEGSTTASSGLSGVWQPDFESRDTSTLFRPVDLPLTAAGQAVRDNYSESEDPALNCEAESMPSVILPIYPVKFTFIENDQLEIFYEEFDGLRHVYIGMDEHPVGITPSLMGHSIGTLDGSILEIETIGFSETVWGLGRGAPSSDQKVVRERYEVSQDGNRMNVEYWFEDPVYLAEPQHVVGEMLRKPGYVMVPWDCDAKAARRHVD